MAVQSRRYPCGLLGTFGRLVPHQPVKYTSWLRKDHEEQWSCGHRLGNGLHRLIVCWRMRQQKSTLLESLSWPWHIKVLRHLASPPFDVDLPVRLPNWGTIANSVAHATCNATKCNISANCRYSVERCGYMRQLVPSVIAAHPLSLPAPHKRIGRLCTGPKPSRLTRCSYQACKYASRLCPQTIDHLEQAMPIHQGLS